MNEITLPCSDSALPISFNVYDPLLSDALSELPEQPCAHVNVTAGTAALETLTIWEGYEIEDVFSVPEGLSISASAIRNANQSAFEIVHEQIQMFVQAMISPAEPNEWTDVIDAETPFRLTGMEGDCGSYTLWRAMTPSDGVFVDKVLTWASDTRNGVNVHVYDDCTRQWRKEVPRISYLIDTEPDFLGAPIPRLRVFADDSDLAELYLDNDLYSYALGDAVDQCQLEKIDGSRLALSRLRSFAKAFYAGRASASCRIYWHDQS